eukprot:2099022-Heterocapsa_arctica.AAC.1
MTSGLLAPCSAGAAFTAFDARTQPASSVWPTSAPRQASAWLSRTQGTGPAAAPAPRASPAGGDPPPH